MNDTGKLFEKPSGYREFHDNLVKNFWLGQQEAQLDDSTVAALPSEAVEEQEIQDFVATIKADRER